MSDEDKTDLEIALEQLGTISGDLAKVPVDHTLSTPERVRRLIQEYYRQVSAARAFRTALASALEARESDGDADLITQATSLLGYVRWCRQQESQIRMRSALAFLNSPFSFHRLDLNDLTPQQNEWRRALLALKDLRTAVDAINDEFSQVTDAEERPLVRRACLDITHNMDVLLAVLSAREGREALLSLIPDVANGGELTAQMEGNEPGSEHVKLILRGPWTQLAIEQYVRELAEDFRKDGREVALTVSLNPPN